MKKTSKRAVTLLLSLSCLTGGLLTSCDTVIPGLPGISSSGDFSFTTNQPTTNSEVEEVSTSENNDIQYQIYQKARNSGYSGTYEEWLDSIKGDSIEIRVLLDKVQWKYSQDEQWQDLFSLSSLKGQDGSKGDPGEAGAKGDKGDKGDKGEAGVKGDKGDTGLKGDKGDKGDTGLKGDTGEAGIDGKTPEFRVSNGYLEWKYTTDSEWKELYRVEVDGQVKPEETPEVIPDGLRWSYYSSNGEKSISLETYTGSSSSLVIPSSIDGDKVKEIWGAFTYNINYSSLTLPAYLEKWDLNIGYMNIGDLYYPGTLSQWNEVDISSLLENEEIYRHVDNFYYLVDGEYVKYANQSPEETISLPSAWGEDSDYRPQSCSITLNPDLYGDSNKISALNYLNNPDIRYIDLRDETEGYGVMHIQGFESISYFKVLVGTGQQLFYTENDVFIPRYEESVSVLNEMFPKDKTYFLMCQSGGRVAIMVKLLQQYGYDVSKVYNIGGINNIRTLENYGGYRVSEGLKATTIEYDFSMYTTIETASTMSLRKSSNLQNAWVNGENETEFKVTNCTVNLIPGSNTNGTATKVKDCFGQEDIKYVDLRDNCEGYSVGHVQGFESFSYFKVLVGSGEASNTTLFRLEDNTFIPNYEESEALLNKMFPKDQTLFVMCQSGGRVVNFIKLLKQYGYDTSKVYNVGGWNNVKSAENYGDYSVSLGVRATSIEYDFSALTLITNS